MKQKMLRLIPYILIFMMVFTACGSQQPRVNGAWHLQETVGYGELDDMTTDQLYLVTFDFRNDGALLLKVADQEALQFQWSIEGDRIVWIMPGTAASSYYYTISGNTLTMWNTAEYLRMVR